MRILHQNLIVWTLLNISKSNYIHERFECTCVCAPSFFYYFIVHLTIFGWNLTKTKTIFIQKLLRICACHVKSLFVLFLCVSMLFWAKKFLKKKKALTLDTKKGAIGLRKFYHTHFFLSFSSHIYDHWFCHKYDTLCDVIVKWTKKWCGTFNSYQMTQQYETLWRQQLWTTIYCERKMTYLFVI